MRKIHLALIGLLLASPAAAQQITAVGPFPPCTAFGTASGQCSQGGVITAGGPTGSATVAPIITYNAAGQLTTVSSATVTPAVGSITGLGAGVATLLAGTPSGTVGLVGTTSPTILNPNMVTPSIFTGLVVNGSSSGTVTLNVPAAAGSNTITIPAVTGTITMIGSANASIVSDSGKTDTSVCQDTTTHQFYSGSGTIGICLGTSGLFSKRDVTPLPWISAFWRIMRSNPVSFFYKSPYGDKGARVQYGFVADWMVGTFPELVGRDKAGHPVSFDVLGVFAWLVRAFQGMALLIAGLFLWNVALTFVIIKRKS